MRNPLESEPKLEPTQFTVTWHLHWKIQIVKVLRNSKKIVRVYENIVEKLLQNANNLSAVYCTICINSLPLGYAGERARTCNIFVS